MESSKKSADIPKFFAGRSIFITGGSGFIGKVLIERLLTTCPDISRLYLLMREKKGQSPETRIQQFKTCQVFDVLRASGSKQLDKIEVLPGDVTRPLLGLTETALEQLKAVSVVFHIAATVKLDEELKKVVNQNLRPVIEIMSICDTLPKLEAFIHVSTAYSNAELSYIQEKVYPPPMELETLLKIVENQDIDEEKTKKLVAGCRLRLTTLVCSCLEQTRIIGSKPNTYTFTKAMSEAVVERHGCKNYAAAIFRPSIVISSLRHPFPGWTEGLNGPSGVIAGARTGTLHVIQIKSDARADMMPVDIIADTLIAVAWETAVDRLSHVRVYNCSSCNNPTTWNTLFKNVTATSFLFVTVQNRYLYKILELILQTIPLHIIQYCKWLLRLKTGLNLIRLNEKYKSINKVTKFFALNEWMFDTDNVVRLWNRLSEADRRLFNLDPKSINWEVFVMTFIKGIWKYVMKEYQNLANGTPGSLNKS